MYTMYTLYSTYKHQGKTGINNHLNNIILSNFNLNNIIRSIGCVYTINNEFEFHE